MKRPNDSNDVRILRPRRAAPSDVVRPTRAEVNLDHLRFNLRALERRLSTSNNQAPEIWGVLKADAYGHGAPAVARTLERAKMPGICVAFVEEGVELRNAGIRIPILVMGVYERLTHEAFEEILVHELTPVLFEPGQVEQLAKVCSVHNASQVRVHIKVDTGIGRLGIMPAQLPRLLYELKKYPNLHLEGLMSHLACAEDSDETATHEQLAQFSQIDQQIRCEGFLPSVRHIANSAAMLKRQDTWFERVRPGIAIFGVEPTKKESSELKPVMRICSEIVAIRNIQSRTAVGYSHTWRAHRPSCIATIPMGYADGLTRTLSNRGWVLVRGKRAPIVGNMSMDLTMIDVTEIPGAQITDEVVLMGAQDGPLGQDHIDAHEVAAWSNTIPWEILTNISRRVPRFYREP